MRKALGIILLVIGITCIGLPILTFFGGACSSSCISASAETVTNPDSSFDIRLSNPISYEYVRLNSDLTATRSRFSILDFDLVISPSNSGPNFGNFIGFNVRSYNFPSQPVILFDGIAYVDFPILDVSNNILSDVWSFSIEILDYEPNLCYIQYLDRIDARYDSGDFCYDFYTVDSLIMFSACISVLEESNSTYNYLTPFDSNSETVYYTVDFVDLYDYAENAYQSGLSDGYNSGLEVSIGDVNPFALVIDTADKFFTLSPFGNNITFGHILSVGFGCVLLGLCIKIFLGG